MADTKYSHERRLPFVGKTVQRISREHRRTIGERADGRRKPARTPTTQAPKIDPVAFTVKQASIYAGVSRSFLYGLFDKRALTRLKAGKRVLILKAELDDYLMSIREVVR